MLNPMVNTISFLSDTLELYYVDSNGTRKEIPLVKKGIAWWTDKHVKFRNPGGNDNLTVSFEGEQTAHTAFLL